MRVISLYCGGGGIDEGLRQAGIKTTLAIDSNEDCCRTMKINHECETICDTVLNAQKSIGRADIIVGGPPCPEFSRAKLERTFDSTEVDLFWNIVHEIMPKYHLMENVVDVIKVCKQKNFLLNCANYGTPQTRKRRFFTNLPRPKHTHGRYPSQTLFEDPIKKWVSVKEALKLDGIIQDRKTTFGDFRNYDVNNPSITLLADSRIWISPTGFPHKNQKLISRTIDNPSQTIVNANTYQLTNHPIYSTKYLKQKNPEIYTRHKPNELDEPVGTILAKDRGTQPDQMVTDGNYARKLTLEEIKILQGFPESYLFSGNKGEQRRQIGNAVPPQVITAFFKQL